MELDALTRAGDVQASWDKTSLKPYIEMFESYIDGLVKDRTRAVKGEITRLFIGPGKVQKRWG